MNKLFKYIIISNSLIIALFILATLLERGLRVFPSDEKLLPISILIIALVSIFLSGKYYYKNGSYFKSLLIPFSLMITGVIMALATDQLLRQAVKETLILGGYSVPLGEKALGYYILFACLGIIFLLTALVNIILSLVKRFNQKS